MIPRLFHRGPQQHQPLTQRKHIALEKSEKESLRRDETAPPVVGCGDGGDFSLARGVINMFQGAPRRRKKKREVGTAKLLADESASVPRLVGCRNPYSNKRESDDEHEDGDDGGTPTQINSIAILLCELALWVGCRWPN